MTDDIQLLILKGHISNCTPEEQDKIKQCEGKLKLIEDEFGNFAHIAMAKYCLELNIADSKGKPA